MTTHPTPAHLGGHFNMTNLDAAALAGVVERYNVRRMVDVGCGPGGMIDLAHTLGIAAFGIDGDPAITHPDVVIHDYTLGPCVLSQPVDLIWCVEFVEHVSARYIPHFLATFAGGRVLCLTHALPGQGGWHHVNEQPPDYWHQVLRAAGWVYDAPGTDDLRRVAENRYLQQTGMLWTRNP